MPVSLDNEMEVLPAFLEKFPAWKNFPTGLHILFLDEDELALQHSRAQLEACRYTVTAFSDKRCAMDALEQRRESFHLAIVEVNLKNSAEAFNVVRAAKHLPTILLSAAKNVTLMMEGIAAGALEFLEKPLSEDKAKNLWQHVFRKALATGELIVPKQEKGEADMVKEPCDKSIEEDHHIKEEQTDPGSVLDASLPIVGDSCDQLFIDDYMYGGNHDADGKEFDCLPDEKPGTSNCLADDFVAKSPGPSTPQLEQAEMRALNTSDDESPHSQDFTGLNACMEDVNSSDDCSSFMCVKRKAEDMEDVFQSNLEGEDLQSLSNFDCLASLSDCKDLNGHDTLEFRDELCLDDDLVDELSSCIDMDSSILDELPSANSLQMSLDCMDDDDQRDEEALLLAEVAKAEAGMSRSAGDYMSDTPLSSGNISDHSDKPSLDRLGKGGKSLAHSKKKMKVDWTAELHRRFVQAVEHLGVDKAIPSRILEIMGVQHLTRHNIASHLQKYRSHKKHMQAREAEAATWNQKRQMEATRQPPQPHVVSRPAPLVPMGLHVWGHPTPDQYWPKPWSSSDGSLWPNPPPVCVDAWGHPAAGAPIFHPSHCLAPFVRIPLAPIPGAINGAVPMHIRAEKLMPGQHPPKDKVDAAINEVMKNPFMPLPLGLKPPSLESVLSELQRQGMKTVPPTTSPP